MTDINIKNSKEYFFYKSDSALGKSYTRFLKTQLKPVLEEEDAVVAVSICLVYVSEQIQEQISNSFFNIGRFQTPSATMLSLSAQ